MRGLSGKSLENELNKLLMNGDESSETLTDILGTIDEREGNVDFHGDEEPNANTGNANAEDK